MARILIGYKEMKNRKGKVLYFAETNPWTVGMCINDKKQYAMGFVFNDDADNITESDVGKEFKFHSGYERV